MYLYIIACVQYIRETHAYVASHRRAAARTMMVFQDKEDNKNVMSLNKMEKKVPCVCVCDSRAREDYIREYNIQLIFCLRREKVIDDDDDDAAFAK